MSANYPHIAVRTGARLHFGPLALGSSTGRQFGGVGVMIDSPGFRLEIAATPLPNSDRYLGPGHWERRVQEALQRIRARLAPQSHSWQVTLQEEIPPHRGLGSGTQLALAITAGCLQTLGSHAPSAAELAEFSGRGLRSAIGLHGFLHGGWLVEPGKFSGEVLSPLLFRETWPEEWKFLLMTPRNTQGISGHAELQAFEELKCMPLAITRRLWKILIGDWWPAMQARDFPTCALAMTEYGDVVGDHFQPVQGGRYADPHMEGLAKQMKQRGLGFAQSSWGPTVAVMCPSLEMAHNLQQELKTSPWKNYDSWIASVRNQPVEITRIE